MLIEALEKERKRQGLSIVDICNKLGIKPRMWQYLKNGKRQPGGKTLSAILHEFPSLKDEVWNYIYNLPYKEAH